MGFGDFGLLAANLIKADLEQFSFELSNPFSQV